MNYRALFVAAVAALFGFAARAVEWSGAQVVTADVDDDVELLDQVEVTVASGSTFAINGKISGSGSIKLVGGGTLQLAVSNDFSGGAYIDTGVLQVLTGGALGTGDITVKGGTKAKSQLQFGELDAAVTGNKTVTFPNNIIIENSGSTSYYQLQFGPHGADGNRKTLNLTGDITCNGDLYFNLNNSWNSAGNIAYYLRGDVTANKLYIDRPSIKGYVYGKLTVDDIVAGSSGSYGLTLYNQENRIARSSLGRQYLQCGAANVLGGLAWVPLYVSTTAGYLGLNSYSQVIAYMDSSDFNTATERKYLPEVRASGAATLTLTGGVESATFEGRLGTITTGKDLNNMISLRIAPTAGSFTQYFTGTNHQMNGTITVEQNGAAVFSGAESALTNVTSITVNGGSFTLDTEVADPLSSLTAITLDSTGTINLGARTVWVDTLTIGGATLLYADHATHSEQIAEGTVLRGRNVASGMSYTTVDLSAFGDWEVNVPAKSTNVVTVAQTGSGKITKKGAGYLLFETANDFSGGVQIDAGVVVVGHAGALGSGPVDIAGATKSACQLCIDTTLVQGTQTISNPITLQSDSATSYPALYFVLPATKESGTPWTVTFTGVITANGDLYIGDNHPYNWQGNKWTVFDCPINAAGHKIEFCSRASLSGDVHFKGKVTADTLVYSGYKSSNAGGYVYAYSSENAIGTWYLDYDYTYAEADDVMGDARLTFAGSYSADNLSCLNTKGHSQHLRSITASVPKDTGIYRIQNGSYSLATVTLDGEAADSSDAGVSFRGALSLVVDAREDGFVQTLRGRGDGDNTMSGTITIKRGTLKIADGSTFKNVTAIDVSGGALEVETTLADCFAGATNLTVKNGGTFIATNATVFVQPLALTLESGAVLKLPSDTELAVASLTVDGMGWRKGAYTKAQIAALPEGVTLNVTADTATEAIWTGAGADNLTTTLANWLIGGEVPTAIDFAHWAPLVTLAGGTGLTYVDGDTFSTLVNDLPVVDEQAEIKTVLPFYIRPATEGATLTVKGNVTSNEKGQLVLSGHLAGGASSTFTYTPAAVETGTEYIEKSNDYFTKGTAALALKGVTIDMNLTVGRATSDRTMLFAAGGTTNVITGKMYFKSNAACASADSGSVVCLRGGVATDNSYQLYGKGEWQFVDEPADRFSCGLRVNGQVRLVFDASNSIVTGNKAREGIVISSGTIDMRCNNCFTNETQIMASAGNSLVRLEFNATTQTFGRASFDLAADNTSSYLNGDYSSVLELTCKIRTGAWSYPQFIKTPYCNARVTGGVGFHMNDQDGGTNVFTLAGRDFESCGDLVVSAGTMELAAGATWLNGTNFTAKGEGMLKFAAAGQVNPSFATIHFEDNGKIYIPEGVTLSVAEAFVREGADETAVERGKYTGAATEALTANRIIGGGTLRVGKRGMMLFVQ